MELYISPAVASVVRICIDEHDQCDWKGRIYTRLNEEPLRFRNMDEMFVSMEAFWDLLGFPQEATINRRFTSQPVTRPKPQKKLVIEISYMEKNAQDKIKVELSEDDMNKKNGEQGTFVVRIQYRQNATWQGHVTWVEENKTVAFRSALELIKLLDSTQQEQTKEWEDKA